MSSLEDEVLNHFLWFITNQVFASKEVLHSKDESGNRQVHLMFSNGIRFDYDTVDENQYYDLLKKALANLAKATED